jgi:hypothetical protein
LMVYTIEKLQKSMQKAMHRCMQLAQTEDWVPDSVDLRMAGQRCYQLHHFLGVWDLAIRKPGLPKDNHQRGSWTNKVQVFFWDSKNTHGRW